jgi:hypothetical protein
MGEQIINTGNEAVKRWHQKMPRFFYWLVIVACGIGGTAFAINSGVPALGGTLDEWWTDIYSYIIGASIATVFVCKFTVAGGYKKIDPDKILRGEHPHGVSSHSTNMSDVDTVSPGEEHELAEIEPYNEHLD